MRKIHYWGQLLLVGVMVSGIVACGDVQGVEKSQNEIEVDGENSTQEESVNAGETDAQEESKNDGEEIEGDEEIPTEREGYSLVWSDEFDGESLDLTKWSYQYGDGSQYGNAGWGNGESQVYTDREENVSVSDGKLTITALKENYEGSSFTSGRIRTITEDGEALFATTFGRVEGRIKLEGGDGIWPAFWMLPADPSIYGTWAASGELDIMEAKGRLPGQVAGTAHYGNSWPGNVYSSKEYFFPEGVDTSSYHTYAIEWTPEKLMWYVDDSCYASLENWYAHGNGEATNFTAPAPFDVDFYILLNVAVGGNFDPDAVVKDDSFPGKMTVDYVRVYEKNGGYEEELAKVRGEEDGLDYDAAKDVLLNKNYIYNGNFNQGTDGMAYWHLEDGALYQMGFGLEENETYGIRFDASSEEEKEVKVLVLSSDNSLIHEEDITIEAAENKIYAYTFDCPRTDSYCSLRLEVGDEIAGTVNHVMLMKLAKE